MTSRDIPWRCGNCSTGIIGRNRAAADAYGASGGVGTWAVQIAKALGAEVTAVCSSRNVDRVRALGADEVVDYTQADFLDGGRRFDLMLDLVGNRSLSDCKRALVPKGTYVACSGGPSATRWLARMAGMAVTSMFSSQRLTTSVVKPNQADLLFLKALVEAGQARPFIERRFPLGRVAEALRHAGARHNQGQTVIQIAGDPAALR